MSDFTYTVADLLKGGYHSALHRGNSDSRQCGEHSGRLLSRCGLLKIRVLESQAPPPAEFEEVYMRELISCVLVVSLKVVGLRGRPFHGMVSFRYTHKHPLNVASVFMFNWICNLLIALET